MQKIWQYAVYFLVNIFNQQTCLQNSVFMDSIRETIILGKSLRHLFILERYLKRENKNCDLKLTEQKERKLFKSNKIVSSANEKRRSWLGWIFIFFSSYHCVAASDIKCHTLFLYSHWLILSQFQFHDGLFCWIKKKIVYSILTAFKFDPLLISVPGFVASV